MNYFDLYSSYPDRTIAAAWDSQVKQANNTLCLDNPLTECGNELFARFAECYAELRTLPRSARRALQRRLARSGELAVILPEYLQRGGRRLQHRMAWSLAGAALLLALGQGVGTAATITVTTNNPNIAADGECSLIEAIVNANNDAATFPDCAAGSGADTIVLPANANLMLSNPYGALYTGPNGTVSGPPVGLPPIASQITIEGNGAIISRPEGAPAFLLMAVRAHAHVFPASPPTGPSGDLTLKNVTLGGGLDGGAFNPGGAISNSGTLAIENSTVSGNTSAGLDFGTLNNVGTLTIKNSTISGNTARDVAGGESTITNNGGTLTIENSTISGNTGQGVWNLYGNLTIQSSTISANQGGGVGNFGGRVAIANSTISGNVSQDGGGVLNAQYCYRSYPCVPATLTLNNSLIAGNQATVGPEIENDASSSVSANNFNLFGTNGNAGVTGFTPGPTDIVPGVAIGNILGPLQNNGGPTQTHALVTGSPAIDAGNPNGCRDNLGAFLSTDQRGLPRAFDGNGDGTAVCDVGAFEGNGADIIPSVSISDVTVTEGNSGTGNATFQVHLSGPSTQPVTVTFSTANRTAAAGTDYLGTSGTLTFDPGETSKTITVVVDANTLLELDKSFLVNLTSVTNAFLGDSQGVGTIVNDDGPLPTALANISSRGGVLTGDNVMIGGFIIDGTTPKRVLIRSRGPSMAGAPFFVPGTLANPMVRLFSGQTVIAQNDNWQDPPSCTGFVCEGAAEIANLGFDPCTPNPGQTTSPVGCALESAILITLPPGAYTAIVSGADGRTGVGLVEVFEADASTVSELGNISTRGFVQNGDDVMIGGVIIEGSAPATVLIRARGPSMSGAPFFVPGTLANPFLQLFSGQDVIAQNNNWQDAPSCVGVACGGPTQIAATGLDPCQPNPGQTTTPVGCAQESAILVTLPPGAYTAIVTGVGGGTGVGLVEVFELN